MTETFDPFDQSKAIARYTQVMRLFHAGLYDETHQAILGLEYEAAQHGLKFVEHKEEDKEYTYTLEQLSDEEKATFLHGIVEKLESLLVETAQYLLSIPYESDLDMVYRKGLHERIVEALKRSYRIPIMREEN